MRFLFTLLISLFIPLAFFAQENTAISDLLNEAKIKLHNQPEQAGKISEYIISQKESSTIQAQALLLLAKSFYVRGNYNDAIKNAMNAKKLADASKDFEIKFETNVFALKIFRTLGLYTVANKYLDELIILKETTKDKNILLRIDGALKQDTVLIHFQNEKYTQAAEDLKKAEAIFLKIGDTTSTIEVNIALAEVLIQSGQLDSANTHLKKLEKQIHNDFEQLQVLDLVGKLHFNRKEYTKATTVFQQALSLSLMLPSKNYESSSLEGLTLSYLALENTKKFFSYKQQASVIATQIETNKNLAINSVYNFINSYQKELSEKKIRQSYIFTYILGGFLIILLLIGLIVNHLYASKTMEYLAIYKYVSPKEPTPSPQPMVEELERSSIVPEETEQLLLQKLNKFESGKKYTDPDMSIALLASQFDTNTKYLSEVINRQKGKNFNAYINELRINYIIEKLKTDSVYFNYKISYLAEESGFSSHSSFATVFKSVTGISPTKFMDFLQQRKETA